MMMKKSFALSLISIKNFKNHEISYIFYKTFALSIICDKCFSNDEKYLKKKNQLRKILGLINNMND